MRFIAYQGERFFTPLRCVQKDKPMDAVRWLLRMNRRHISSDKVTQDVLLVGGENDTFQPVKLLHQQGDALVNAHSVTTRVFTKAENADNYVQMGNLNLATTEIEGWLGKMLAELKNEFY